MVQSLISTGILLAASLVFFKSVSPFVLLLPLAYVPLVFLTLGLGWFLASLGVYVRDIGQAIGVATQVLFFLSPIFLSGVGRARAPALHPVRQPHDHDPDRVPPDTLGRRGAGIGRRGPRSPWGRR